MSHLNIEIKAKVQYHDRIRNILNSLNAEFRGLDHQIDTYFKIGSGRLKLREGNLESYLIHYQREDKEGPKKSEVSLFKYNRDKALKEILFKSLDVLTVVDKRREIYFINNIKFHLDEVMDLGLFVEIEAIDSKGDIGGKKLLKQCQYYQKLLEIKKEDLISCSYSDMLLDKSL